MAEQGLELRLLIPGVRLGVTGAKSQFREFLAGEERVKQPTKEGAGHIPRSQGIHVWRRSPQLASCCALRLSAFPCLSHKLSSIFTRVFRGPSSGQVEGSLEN